VLYRTEIRKKRKVSIHLSIVEVHQFNQVWVQKARFFNSFFFFNQTTRDVMDWSWTDSSWCFHCCSSIHADSYRIHCTNNLYPQIGLAHESNSDKYYASTSFNCYYMPCRRDAAGGLVAHVCVLCGFVKNKKIIIPKTFLTLQLLPPLSNLLLKSLHLITSQTL